MLQNDVRPFSVECDNPAAPAVSPEFENVSIERHGYRAPASSRWLGLGGTSLLGVIVMAGFFVTLSVRYSSPKTQPALSVFDIAIPASPPEMQPEEKVAPERMRKQMVSKVQVPEPLPAISPVAPAPSAPIKVAEVADSPPRLEPAAPRTLPALPAPQLISNGPDRWEGRVLAQLNKHRRYPRSAMFRRQQGVSYVRFVMDRDGKVLSSTLESSSGVADLDREALSLPRRAQPLPKPPADKPGDTFELVAPVEFFIR